MPRRASTIPAIDRMMGVLALEEQPDGASITALTTALALPRSTVYRILNTLEAHDVVQRDGSGCYRLGGVCGRSPPMCRPARPSSILPRWRSFPRQGGHLGRA